jgi:hypothetical protein
MNNVPFGKAVPLFQRLMRPLSNVMHTVLLEKGDKRILLIGEAHGGLHYGSLGFVPISRIIVDYLRNVPEKVDFIYVII